MRKNMVLTVALALFLTSVADLPRAAAQEPAKEVEAQLKAIDLYKVEFTMNELENGKKLNSRTYSMLMRTEAIPKWTDTKHLRVGSRVPVSTGNNAVQYMDVGMDIECRLLPIGNSRIDVGTKLEYSTIEAEPAHEAQTPVIRQVRSDVEAVVPMEKPIVLAELDDVASTHRYVFEVKVTKINL